ncbi:hypothetical protein BJX96DRAFT_27304 [Aspergillus floccosus]
MMLDDVFDPNDAMESGCPVYTWLTKVSSTEIIHGCSCIYSRADTTVAGRFNNDLLRCLAVVQALHSRFLSAPLWVLGNRESQNEYEISYSVYFGCIRLRCYLQYWTARNCGRLLENSERPTSFNLNRGGLVGAGGAMYSLRESKGVRPVPSMTETRRRRPRSLDGCHGQQVGPPPLCRRLLAIFHAPKLDAH